MTVVSGDLILVTDDPARVTGAWVHATTRRLDGDRVVLTGQGEATHDGGSVEFESVPGPAVLELRLLGGGSDTVSLVVPDADSASLADCVRNAEMAGERDAGELAGILEQIRASVGESAEARAGAEAAAEDAAGSAEAAGRDAARAETAAGEAATEAAGLAADAVRLAVKEDADRSAAGATTATEKAAEAAGSATRAETAETGAVEAEEGAEAGQELSEDAAAVAVAAAIGVQTAFHQYTGVGFPEGRVSAPVGAVYTDTAATNGAVRWIKTAGTGNTGWQVQYGNTGQRVIAHDGTGGTLRIQRTENTVTIGLNEITLTEGRGAFILFVVPHGFRPADRISLITHNPRWDDIPSVWGSFNGLPANFSWLRKMDGIYDRPTIATSGTATFLTNEPWPSTLPGVPA